MKRRMSTIIIGALLFSGCGKEEAPVEAIQEERTETKGEPEKAPAATPDEKPVAEKTAAEKTAEPEEAKAAEPQPEAESHAEAEATGTKTGVAAEVGEPSLVAREGFHLAALTLARGVEKTADKKRVPLEPGSSFEIDGRRVYAILDIENPKEEEGKLRVGWIWPGSREERNTISIAVKPEKKWRTWAFNGFIKKPGLWEVVLRDEADGEVLGRASFEMQEADQVASASGESKGER